MLEALLIRHFLSQLYTLFSILACNKFSKSNILRDQYSRGNNGSEQLTSAQLCGVDKALLFLVSVLNFFMK